MKNIFISIAIITLLVNCGGSSDGGDGRKASNEIMKISKLYTVNPGDKVIKSDQNITTTIKIYHAGNSKESVIELVEGNATIIRK